jgi:hypothetical protein
MTKVLAEPGLNVTELEERLKERGLGTRRGDANKWLQDLEKEHQVVRVKDGRSLRHYLPGHVPADLSQP